MQDSERGGGVNTHETKGKKKKGALRQCKSLHDAIYEKKKSIVKSLTLLVQNIIQYTRNTF
jgi:hypothetical protein